MRPSTYRNYQNDGSFKVEREDARVAFDVTLPHNYKLGLSYRNVDYEEDRLEAFDADIWELAIRYRW